MEQGWYVQDKIIEVLDAKSRGLAWTLWTWGAVKGLRGRVSGLISGSIPDINKAGVQQGRRMRKSIGRFACRKERLVTPSGQSLSFPHANLPSPRLSCRHSWEGAGDLADSALHPSE